MKVFLRDWRNSALVIAVVVFAIMLIRLVALGSESAARKIVRVGDRVFTDKDIVAVLKQRMGDQVVMGLVSNAIIESYAAQKGVSASESEIDQLVHFQEVSLQLQNQSLSDTLKSQGMTMEEFRNQLRVMVLEIKLIIPESEIRAAVASDAKAKKSVFTLPPLYQLRVFYFESPELANKAAALLKKPQGEEEAANLAINSDSGLKVISYTPGRDALIDKLLVKLKVGQSTDPLTVPSEISDIRSKNMRRIIQLVDYTPAEPPTFENRGMVVAQQLISSAPKYATKGRDLEAEALSKVDVQFYSDEYKKATESFLTLKRENPNIPTAVQNETLKIPGAKPVPSSPPAASGGR